jgi:hypothetical protein
MTDLSARYRRHGESLLIEMKLSTLAQLFNSLDPSPFLEKDLDDDAEAYIVDTAHELPSKTSLRLVIHLPRDAIQPDTAESVTHAIHNYFDYKTQIADANLRRKLREGRKSLLIGLLFLAACLSARELIAGLGTGTAVEIVQEGLLISGWVAMWRPIQMFLYDWWPIRNLRTLYYKLSHIKVEIRPSP